MTAEPTGQSGVPADAEAPTRTRAPALPRSERRAEIVAATLPLLLTHGSAVTTRQIADAAGIAEGTVFRVFPDKESLIEAAVDSAFDMAPVDAGLAAIDPTLDLERRLVAAVEILRRRFADILRLQTTVEMLHVSRGATAVPDRYRPSDLSGLAALFERDRDNLRCDPLEAAHLLRGLTVVGTHPALIRKEPLSAAEIVSLFLDGVRVSTPDGLEHPEDPC